MVDEQDALEVVQLVQDAARQQAIGFDLLLDPFGVEVAQLDLAGPPQFGELVGQRETAFLGHDLLVRRPDDLRVDQAERRAGLVLARDIDDDDALGHADLDRREPDARRVVHGLDHVVHQLAQIVVDPLDGFGLDLEARIGRDDDGQDRHGSDCSRFGEFATA